MEFILRVIKDGRTTNYPLGKDEQYAIVSKVKDKSTPVAYEVQTTKTTYVLNANVEAYIMNEQGETFEKII